MWKPSGFQSSASTLPPWPRNVWIILPERQSQTWTMPAKSPVATSDPSPWKPTLYVSLAWPSCSSTSEPVSTSQSRHVWSNDVVATCAPRGWNATFPSRARWPRRRTSSRPGDADSGFASQSAAVASAPAVATTSDDGAHARPVTRSACALGAAQTFSHRAASQMHKPPDQPPVATRPATGDDRTRDTGRASAHCDCARLNRPSAA
mmetsp:Transcript_10157/g.31332  ORF Transcript_10157/g.31332 Transcript_10157/m.31332 type:complete len:206 (-) Transcript_10157:683-1300(-)